MTLQYSAKVVAHSISELGNEIITWELIMPKWMVAEFNTHKIEIERNSASSRAVPTGIIIDMINEEPCIPIWTYNESGMAANEPLSEEDAEYATKIWLEIRDLVIPKVQQLQKLPSGRSVSKGVANRPLEFVMWTKVVCTMTKGGQIGMNNLFGLRDNKAAQPEFQVVAHMMHEQVHTSVPTKREWHLPYMPEEDYNNVDMISKAVQSSAMCGRVTHYRNGDINPKTGQPFTEEENILRGLSFADSGHFSPLRHASRAGDASWYGNMFGWKSVSKIMFEKDYMERCCER